LGRFVGRDAIGYKGNDANSYRYIGGRATTATDASGLTPADPGWRVPPGTVPVPPPISHTPPVVEDPNTCQVQLQCAFIGNPIWFTGTFFGVALHCGLRVTHNGHVTFHHVATPDSCRVDPRPATGRYFSPYRVFAEWSFADDKVCRCIKATSAAIPGGKYHPIPGNDPCGGPPTCNSNYVTKCLMNHCGLDFSWNWAWEPVGWDHRMAVCIDVRRTSTCCWCNKWQTIDDTWCAKRRRDQLP
jgi:hypothetical protein